MLHLLLLLPQACCRSMASSARRPPGRHALAGGILWRLAMTRSDPMNSDGAICPPAAPTRREILKLLFLLDYVTPEYLLLLLLGGSLRADRHGPHGV